MNTQIANADVEAFVATVRAQLADLDPEEQNEITDGLVADLTDLVAEQGDAALGDPIAYAAELRAAAGLAAPAETTTPRRPLAEGMHRVFDDAGARWRELVGVLPGDVQGFLATLQPVWWVARGWAAAFVIATVLGIWESNNPFGWVLLGVAVIGSVQLGRGRLWPRDRTRTHIGWRGVLLVLNVFAAWVVLAMIANSWMMPTGLGRSAYDQGYEDGSDAGAAVGYPIDEQDGVYAHGKWITNIYPYDAAGNPVQGIQLFDQDGAPIAVVAQPQCLSRTGEVQVIPVGDEGLGCEEFFSDADQTGDLAQGIKVFYPWTNGSTPLTNVFPIPSRMQESAEPSGTAFVEGEPPTIGEPPLGTVAPVSVPGVAASVLTPPEADQSVKKKRADDKPARQ